MISEDRYQPIQGSSLQTVSTPVLAGFESADESARFSASVLLPEQQPLSLQSFPTETLSDSETSDAPFPQVGEVRPIVLPRPAPPTYQFELLQQWEGTVLSVREDEFDAELSDRTGRATDLEIATFPLEEVSESDRDLVVSGAVFYWSIGFEVARSGQKRRVSLIRFRRLPTWTVTELAVIEREASELRHLLGLD